MKKCLKCNLKVNTFKKTCPLCGEILTDDKETLEVVPYPNYKVQAKKKNVALKIIKFLLIIASIASIVINYYTFSSFNYLWSVIVLASAIYLWLFLKDTILSKRLMAQRLVILSIASSVFFILVDLVSLNDYKLNWSIEYMVPFISIASTLTILFILFIKKIKYRSYLLHLFASIIIGFVPLVLILTNVVNVVWPSLASSGLSLATIIGIFIFADKETRSEIKKRFHI